MTIVISKSSFDGETLFARGYDDDGRVHDLEGSWDDQDKELDNIIFYDHTSKRWLADYEWRWDDDPVGDAVFA